MCHILLEAIKCVSLSLLCHNVSPRSPKKSEKSPKVRFYTLFGLFLDSFGTSGRTLSRLLGPCPGDSFGTLFGIFRGSRARRVRETLCGAGPIASFDHYPATWHCFCFHPFIFVHVSSSGSSNIINRTSNKKHVKNTRNEGGSSSENYGKKTASEWRIAQRSDTKRTEQEDKGKRETRTQRKKSLTQSVLQLLVKKKKQDKTPTKKKP